MNNRVHIFGIAGSLRAGSYHRGLLRAAKTMLPENSELTVYEGLTDIPPFNQDQEMNMPKPASDLKKAVEAADAILFATPEYNYSYPGVLKNAIDWASRPYGDNSWFGKPVGLMSASVGMVGGARAQYHLRQTFVFLNMFPLNQPEVIIPEVAQKFDEKSNLTDEYTKEKIGDLLQALVQWTRQLRIEMPVKKQPVTERYPYEDTYTTMSGEKRYGDQAQ